MTMQFPLCFQYRYSDSFYSIGVETTEVLSNGTTGNFYDNMVVGIGRVMPYVFITSLCYLTDNILASSYKSSTFITFIPRRNFVSSAGRTIEYY